MNKIIKRNITAFLLSMLMIVLVTILMVGIVVLAMSMGDTLPYVLIGLLFIGVAFILSFPMRDYLIERELRKEFKIRKNKTKIKHYE